MVIKVVAQGQWYRVNTMVQRAICQVNPALSRSWGLISPTACKVLRELLLDECKPVLAHVACGHSMPTMSLPLGLNAMMDATAGTLTILE